MNKVHASCSINVMANRLLEFMASKYNIMIVLKIFKCIKLSSYFSTYDYRIILCLN